MAVEPGVVELAIEELIMERQGSHGAALTILQEFISKEAEFKKFCQKLLTSVKVGQ